MLISLLHPSRGRPDKAYNTAMQWINSANVAVEHIFSLDASDPYLHQYQNIEKTIVRDNDCVVQAVNEGAKEATGDIIIYLSDDFSPFHDWGQVLRQVCLNYSGEYMIKVNDGLQVFQNDVITIPIMSEALYERLGYFFHPAYKSMWVDVDLYHVCNNLGVLKMHPEITFQHNHYVNKMSPKDETYMRSDRHHETGRAIHEQRKRQGYPCV